MADTQPLTLQQRIAQLNAAHIGRVPGELPVPPTRPKPQLPSKRPDIVKQHSINNPPEHVHGSVTDIQSGNQPASKPPPPALPLRRQAPPLPARKSNENTGTPQFSRNKSVERAPLSERTSSEQDSRNSSQASSTTSSINGDARPTLLPTKSSDRLKAPAWGDVQLPVLPPRGNPANPRKFSNERPKYVNRAPPSASNVATLADTSAQIVKQPMPPRLPLRKSQSDLRAAEAPGRNVPPMPSMEALEKAKRSALSFAMNLPTAQPNHPVQPAAASEQDLCVTNGTTQYEEPPPIPVSSRPDLAALQATKPKFSSNTSSPDQNHVPGSGCMVCRDFSGPDHHASLFPRQQVTSLQNLAIQLTSPFASLTDKARVIFTWLHYNIQYDVVSFFGGCVKGSTPQSTLQSGLAVCEGYAALFTHLATFAGLESIVIGGHGKGYGYHQLSPGSSLPPYSAGHAWNAVKIDGGEWKLIDACWGAGHVQGAGQPYVQQFNPSYFTMSNEEFGVKHFPGNKDQFFLPGGRRMSWEEYIQIDPASWPDRVEPPTVFTNAKGDYSIGEKTVMPRNRRISVYGGGIVRFYFGLLCPHWTLETHTKKGPPPVFMVAVNGVDGRNKDHIPLEYARGQTPGGGGDVWYVDIPARELGVPGMTVTLFAVTSFGDRQNARGLTVREFREGKGRVGMGFTGIAAWDLV